MNFKRIGVNVKIFGTSKIAYPENVEIGDNVIIDDFVLIIAKKKIIIGSNVHIASFVSITGNEELIIGDFTGLSTGCKVLTSTDDFSGPYLSNPTVPDEYKNVTSKPIIMKKFALIGANTIILPGSIIEEGVSIGANSLVNCVTEPYSVYVGSPIRKVKEKDRERILFLEKNYREKYGGENTTN